MRLAGYVDRVCPQCRTWTQHRIIVPRHVWACLNCNTTTAAHDRKRGGMETDQHRTITPEKN